MPVTCPPVTAETFDLPLLENCDLIYFDLHGLPGAGFWQGDGRIVALNDWQIRQAELAGAVVFATNCHLGDDNSPMLDALLDAGARAVIAGAGRNWAPEKSIAYGAGLLGMWVRRGLEMRMAPEQALALAKTRVRLSGLLNQQATEDTLKFKVYRRGL